MSITGGAIKRIEEKLKKSKEAENFYETHQLYTTLYYRYNSKKCFQEARNLVSSGALYLFEKGQPGSAAHLSLLYVESLEKHVNEVQNADVEIIRKIQENMPSTLSELEAFTSRIIVWSSTCVSTPKTGNKEIREIFATNYWKRNMFDEARQHFLYSDAGKEFGIMLQEFAHAHGLPGEVDMFITQAVLQLLCIQRAQAANDCFHSYVKHHPQALSGPPYKYPLMNFVFFLLVAVKDGRVVVFEILCDKYQVVLQRDLLYVEYLEKIAQHYFGVAPSSKKGKGGFLDNFMQTLFDDESEKPADVSSPVTSMTVEDLD
uniref:Golgi to ER traffic protein 4 homolog n=1 Tax=Phallusia mammillata TaxID=59560 RepID=A0A6F9DCU3_9ASCI|nr:Golgi to ER traffic protein 4 homolog [Phallusia mammillata]